MKRFIFENNIPNLDDLSEENITNYSERTVWGQISGYFRRTYSGYAYQYIKNDKSTINGTFSANHGLARNEILNQSRYSAIVGMEKISEFPESTLNNTLITNDGIVLIFFSGPEPGNKKSLIVYDLFARDNNDGYNFGSNNTTLSDESSVKKDQTIMNSQGSALSFIGIPDNNGYLKFKKDILFSKDGWKYFYSNARYFPDTTDSGESLEIDFHSTSSIDSGLWRQPSSDFNDCFTCIEFPRKQCFIFKFKDNTPIVEVYDDKNCVNSSSVYNYSKTLTIVKTNDGFIISSPEEEYEIEIDDEITLSDGTTIIKKEDKFIVKDSDPEEEYEINIGDEITLFGGIVIIKKEEGKFIIKNSDPEEEYEIYIDDEITLLDGRIIKKKEEDTFIVKGSEEEYEINIGDELEIVTQFVKIKPDYQSLLFDNNYITKPVYFKIKSNKKEYFEVY